MAIDIVHASTYIHAPYERVWQAINRPEGQESWYVAPCLALGLEPGERVAWGREGQAIIQGHLTRREPAARLAYTFEFTHLDEAASVVEWELLSLGEVVSVEVRHTFQGDSLESQALVTEGWVVVLARLKTLLETGHAMPWPEWDEADEA